MQLHSPSFFLSPLFFLMRAVSAEMRSLSSIRVRVFFAKPVSARGRMEQSWNGPSRHKLSQIFSLLRNSTRCLQQDRPQPISYHSPEPKNIGMCFSNEQCCNTLRLPITSKAPRTSSQKRIAGGLGHIHTHHPSQSDYHNEKTTLEQSEQSHCY